jgi:hypothetical protein
MNASRSDQFRQSIWERRALRLGLPLVPVRYNFWKCFKVVIQAAACRERANKTESLHIGLVDELRSRIVLLLNQSA